MEIYEVVVVDLIKNDLTTLTVEVDEGETTEDIVIKADVLGQEVIASNYNYLPAYQEFRDKLLQLGLGIKCNGSKVNAVQSGMMGANDKIYLVEMGKQARMKDVVHIWDYAEIDTFPDTKQQITFFEHWVKTDKQELIEP